MCYINHVGEYTPLTDRMTYCYNAEAILLNIKSPKFALISTMPGRAISSYYKNKKRELSYMSYKLLEPFKFGPITLRNRIVLAPMATMFSSADGSVTQRMIGYYTRYARGGVGLVILETASPGVGEALGLPVMLGLHHDRYLPGLSELAESIKLQGAAAIIQTAHPGHQTTLEITGGLQPIAPSPIPSQFYGVMPREATQEDIDAIQETFAACAKRAQIAGFDGIEINGANGYLYTEFLSPRLNQRIDKYGGSIENRARMALETFAKMRARTSPEFILGYRLCADEHMPSGITNEDVVTFAKMMEEAGIDYLSVTSGTYESVVHGVPPMYVPRGLNADLCQIVKKAVNVPVICAGGFDVETGEKALRDGKADLIAIGRGLVADPEMPLKLMEGRLEDIRPCIRGNLGCIGEGFNVRPLNCEVNPGIRMAAPVTPTPFPKKVMVIGGGIAGMEAARLASEQGHKVVLIEKEANLGGHMLEASAPSFRGDLKSLLIWLQTQIGKDRAIDLRLSTKATPELVKKEKPDVLIIAVGSEYVMPPELTSYAANFTLPDEVLLGKKNLGSQVAVIGGGFVGCETALYIAEDLKKKVAIISRRDEILTDMREVINMVALMRRLEAAGVEIKAGLTAKSYSPDKLVCTDKAGKEQTLKADSVVLARGLQPKQDIAAKFEGLAPKVFKVGDCVRASNVFHAFRSVWNTVLSF
jgi:2,4-dienoyl-CoA reductase-like NADH-dependent reductase (Old Yellow Enzyme family)/thioredoxin reductase